MRACKVRDLWSAQYARCRTTESADDTPTSGNFVRSRAITDNQKSQGVGLTVFWQNIIALEYYDCPFQRCKNNSIENQNVFLNTKIYVFLPRSSTFLKHLGNNVQ